MDGEVPSKTGLMASLVLMNLTAVALFFFAAPTSREIPKNQDGVSMVAEMVMARDTDEDVVDGIITEMTPGAVKLGSMEGEVYLNKSNEDRMNSDSRYTEAQTLPGKVEMRVTYSTPIEMETCDRQTDPPLVIALKKFVGRTSSGVKIFFKGLKNGYTTKSTQVKTATDPNMRKETLEMVEGSSKISGSVSTANSMPGCSNHELVSEMVIDVLSRTQKRTNELFDLFSRKVVPAIEGINDKVAKAIQLEKNLDFYTSALINSINSVAYPKVDTEINLKHSAIQEVSVRQSKQFLSDLSLMKDSRLHDYVGPLSKGESRPLTKRPTFKTLAARCWYTKYKRIGNNKHKRRVRSEHLNVPEMSGKSEQPKPCLSWKHKLHTQSVMEQADDSELYSNVKYTKDLLSDLKYTGRIYESAPEMTGPLHFGTIRVEEVLELSSKEDQSRSQGLDGGQDSKSIQSNVSSGMVSSDCAETPERAKKNGKKNENDSRNFHLFVDQTDSLGSSIPISEVHSHQLVMQQEALLDGKFSILCDSRIQGDESVQKEISAAAASSREDIETQLFGSLPSASTVSNELVLQGDSNHSISLLGSMSNTIEMVNAYQLLNFQQKELTTENFFLLVLQIFDAWTDSQPISPLGLSRISLSSWSSTDKTSQSSQPRTAICQSREAAAEIKMAEGSLMGMIGVKLRNILSKRDMDGCKNSADVPDQSGFGDIKDCFTAGEELSASLMSTSHESMIVSKESSATFYTGQTESSEDDFYEAKSSMSAGTLGSIELEVAGSSASFLDRTQKETNVRKNQCPDVKPAVINERHTAQSAFSIESWVSDSGEELLAKDDLTLDEFPASNISDVDACGRNVEVYPSCSSDTYFDETAIKKTKNGQLKKKWTSMFLKKLLRKKYKPSSFPSDSLSNPSNQNLDMKDCKPIE